MPELAEVEFYRRRWSPAFGETITQVHLSRDPRVFRQADPASILSHLTGSVLETSEAHGKRLAFLFSGRTWLSIHLGMTGSLALENPSFVPTRHHHLVLRTPSAALAFRDPRKFGCLCLWSGQGTPPWWQDRPPDILEPGFTHPLVARFLSRHGRSPVKAVLLMQEGFPGIGNWMADEILWRARIAPATRALNLTPPRIRRLHRETVAVARQAMEVIAPSWGTPPDSWLFNHRWKNGGACPRTGAPLIRETIAGRTTCWSPSWQR